MHPISNPCINEEPSNVGLCVKVCVCVCVEGEEGLALSLVSSV